MADKLPVLPEELLLRIVSELIGPDTEYRYDANQHLHKRTLANFARTNRQFHRLALPFLYRSIRPGLWSSPWLARLVRTLVSKPKLADLIRNVWIDCSIFDAQGDDGYDGQWAQVREAFDQADWQRLEARVDQFGEFYGGESFCARLRKALRKGSSEAFMTLLLLIAPNINFLQTEAPYEWSDVLMMEIVEVLARLAHDPTSTTANPAISTSVLPKLKHIQVEHADTEGATRMGELKYLLRLPSLTCFRGHALTITEDEGMRTFEYWPCTLRKINLTYSLVDAVGLARLLRPCQSLEELTIEWGGATVGDECDIFWPDIGDALRQNGKSLRVLELDPREAFFFEYDDYVPCRPLGDLQPLVSLKELRVPYMCLLGEDDEEGDSFPNLPALNIVDILPQSLEHLGIVDGRGALTGLELQELNRQLVSVMAHRNFDQLCKVSVPRGEAILEDFHDSGWKRSLTNYGQMFTFERVVGD